MDVVARRAVEVLGLEFAIDASGEGSGFRRLGSRMRKAASRFLTAIGVLGALDFLRHLLFGS